MKVLSRKVITNKKPFFLRLVGNPNGKYVFVAHHGALSSKASFKLMEEWGRPHHLFVSFDARGNGESPLPTVRWKKTYVNDLRDVVLWVKSTYPEKRVILVGSSWGAAIIVAFLRYYPSLVYKAIAWSIPHTAIKSPEAKKSLNVPKSQRKNVLGAPETTRFGYLWRFIITILFNVNFSVYAVIPPEQTTKNPLVGRVITVSGTVRTTTKYLWSTYTQILKSLRLIKKLNRSCPTPLLYIQSRLDLYNKAVILAGLSKKTGDKVCFLLIDEFAHAMQWEVANNLNTRVFETVSRWIRTGKVSFTLPHPKPTSTPFFSFLVPVRNVAHYITKALDSVLLANKNTLGLRYEVIVVDDFSTDETPSILKAYAAQHKNVKLCFLTSHQGLAAARNKAIALSSGKWVVFLDGDDWLSPNFITRMAIHIDNQHNFYVYRIVKESKAARQDIRVQKRKVFDSIVARVVDRNLFCNYRFPSDFKYAIEDWDFYVKMWNHLHVKDISQDDKIFYYYRYNPLSLSKGKNVYRSRLTHAIKLYQNPKYRQLILANGLYGHYYEHLYLTATLWYPDLVPAVKKIRYPAPRSFITWLSLFLSHLKIFNPIMRRWRKSSQE